MVWRFEMVGCERGAHDARGSMFHFLVTIIVENDDRGWAMMMDSHIFGKRKLQLLPKNWKSRKYSVEMA